MTNLPIAGVFNITAIFGQKGKYWANGHKGIDIVAQNKTIYSPCDGVVRVVAYDANGWGQYVSIADEGGQRHILCHLVKGSVQVKAGQSVTRATVIGTMGTTGNSTGVHLHYELHDKDNVVIDVTKYIGIPNKKGSYNSNNFHIEEDPMVKYKDDAAIPGWAKDEIYQMTELGILNGDEKGKFNPNSGLTRAEFAVALARLYAKTSKK